MLRALSVFLALSLCIAGAWAGVIEDFDAWSGSGVVVADPDDPSNNVLALTGGQYVEIPLPATAGVVTVDVYDFGEAALSSSSAYGPRWCIEGLDEVSGQASSIGASIIYRPTLDGSQGYGYSNETSRVGSWFSPGWFGGPRQCTLETWNGTVDLNNGAGQWTTWTFDVQEDGSVELSAPFGSGGRTAKTTLYNGTPISVPGLNKVWLSGGRAGLTVGPVAGGPYAGYTVLFDKVAMLSSVKPNLRDGDANGDGIVDIQDFVILKQNYGQPGDWFKGDFNVDGVIDIQDFVILKQNYGKRDFAELPSYVDNFDPDWNAAAQNWRVATWLQNGTQMSRDRCAVDGEGHMVQTVLAGEPYSGGSMQTSIEFPYGRWVSRLKPSSVPGVLNSMFTKDWEDYTTLTPNDGTGFEVDIELLTYTFGPNSGQVHIAIHPPGRPNFYSENVQLDFNPSDDFHEWGFDVLPDKVVWHVDGEELRTWVKPDFIDIPDMYEMFYNAWTSENWINGPPAENAYYQIDWVKFYPWQGDE